MAGKALHSTDSLPYHTALPSSLDGTDPTYDDIELNAPRPRYALLFRDSPTLRDFFRQNWSDLLTIALLNGLSLVLYKFSPLWNPHLIMLERVHGRMSILDPRVQHPWRSEIIPTWLSALISFICPAAVILVLSRTRIRKFQACNGALMALGFALAIQTLISTVLKLSIGGLRPHFLDVCHPVVDGLGVGPYRNWYEWDQVCRGAYRGRIREALMTFPSGHAGAAFAGFIFLAL